MPNPEYSVDDESTEELFFHLEYLLVSKTGDSPKFKLSPKWRSGYLGYAPTPALDPLEDPDFAELWAMAYPPILKKDLPTLPKYVGGARDTI